jgi:hypothetical protein
MNITMEMRIFCIKIMILVVNYYNNIYHEFVEAQDSKASVAEGRAGGIVDNTLLICTYLSSSAKTICFDDIIPDKDQKTFDF